VFASDPLVLAYEPGAAGLTGITATNWFQKIVGTGVTLGVPNASSDPLGANAIYALELTDQLTHQGGSFYGHFFNGAMGAFATPTSVTKYVSENVAATALSTGEVSTFLIYRSYAVADHLSMVSLNSSVDLGAFDPADVARYSSVKTAELTGTSTSVKSGAPVLFALTVPDNAPDYALGVAFAADLLSNATAAAWVADGFVPLAPLWGDATSHLPPALAGTAPSGVAPLPSYLAALLA
jgi:molybdate/tungstate transport system substrate-binding protein